MKQKNNSKIFCLIAADVFDKKLYVTSETMMEARKFGSAADALINQYRNRYPKFSLEINDLYFINFIFG